MRIADSVRAAQAEAHAANRCADDPNHRRISDTPPSATTSYSKPNGLGTAPSFAATTLRSRDNLLADNCSLASSTRCADNFRARVDADEAGATSAHDRAGRRIGRDAWAVPLSATLRAAPQGHAVRDRAADVAHGPEEGVPPELAPAEATRPWSMSGTVGTSCIDQSFTPMAQLGATRAAAGRCERR